MAQWHTNAASRFGYWPKLTGKQAKAVSFGRLFSLWTWPLNANRRLTHPNYALGFHPLCAQNICTHEWAGGFLNPSGFPTPRTWLPWSKKQSILSQMRQPLGWHPLWLSWRTRPRHHVRKDVLGGSLQIVSVLLLSRVSRGSSNISIKVVIFVDFPQDYMKGNFSDTPSYLMGTKKQGVSAGSGMFTNKSSELSIANAGSWLHSAGPLQPFGTDRRRSRRCGLWRCQFELLSRGWLIQHDPTRVMSMVNLCKHLSFYLKL